MKKRSKWLLGTIIILGGLAAVIFFGLRGFAANEARKFLTQRNVPVNSLTLESITPSAIILKDISLGSDENFTAESLIITRLSGTSLETIRVRVEASNVTVDGLHNGQKWLMGGVENLWEKEKSSSSNTNAPTAKVALRGGSLNVEGSLNADVEGTVKATSLRYIASGLNATINGITLTPKVTQKGTQLNVPFDFKKTEVSNEKGPLVAPLAMAGTVAHKLKSDAVNGTVNVSDLAKKMRVKGIISHVLSAQKGTVKLSTNQVPFGSSSKSLSLTTLLPTIAANTPTPDMNLKLNSVLRYTANGMQNFNGDVTFNQLKPGNILQKALSGYGQLSGELKGNVPFTLTPNSWKIENGIVENNGPMQLSLLQGDKQKLVANLASLLKPKLGGGAVDQINISKLTLNLNSINDSKEVRLKGQVIGNNPLVRRPINQSIDFTTNLNTLLQRLAKAAQ